MDFANPDQKIGDKTADFTPCVKTILMFAILHCLLTLGFLSDNIIEDTQFFEN